MSTETDLVNESKNPYRSPAPERDLRHPTRRYVAWFVASSLLGLFIALGLKHGPYILLVDAIRAPVRFILFVAVVSAISAIAATIGYNRSINAMTARANAAARVIGGSVLGFVAVASETPLRTLALEHGVVTTITQQHAIIFLVVEVMVAILASLFCEYCWRRANIRVSELRAARTNHGLGAEASEAPFSNG